ncbi:hypothetical protein ABPG74_022280 [Tetrahymena malaccensis]
MKLTTVLGITSILSLLFVSTILVLKQDNSSLSLNEFEGAGCFKGLNDYNPDFYVPYHYYVWNTCSLPKKFTITYDQGTIETGCLYQNVKTVTTIHEQNVSVYQVEQSNC